MRIPRRVRVAFVAALLLGGCTAPYAPRVIDGYPLGVQICMDFGTCFDEPAREAWRWLDEVDPGHVHIEIEGYLADYRDAAGTHYLFGHGTTGSVFS